MGILILPGACISVSVLWKWSDISTRKKEKVGLQLWRCFSLQEMHYDLKETNRHFFTGAAGYQRLTATLYLQFPDLHALFVLPFLLQLYLSNDIRLTVLLSKYIRNSINVHIQTHTQTGTHTHHQSLLTSLSKSKNIISE